MVGFYAALQRGLKLFRIAHLFAVTADGFGHLHEARRVDMGAVLAAFLPALAVTDRTAHLKDRHDFVFGNFDGGFLRRGLG